MGSTIKLKIKSKRNNAIDIIAKVAISFRLILIVLASTGHAKTTTLAKAIKLFQMLYSSK